MFLHIDDNRVGCDWSTYPSAVVVIAGLFHLLNAPSVSFVNECVLANREAMDQSEYQVSTFSELGTPLSPVQHTEA